MIPAGGKCGTALQAATAMGCGKYDIRGTALPAAMITGYVEIVTLLLENGADPNVQGGSCALRMSDSHYTCRWRVRDGTTSSSHERGPI
jgi:hypothetical protein